MSDIVYRKCPECGVLNLNKDHCQNCGTLINTNLKREEQRKKRIAKRVQLAKEKKPNKFSLFLEKTREHPNIFVRGVAKTFYSIWVVVLAIGGFLAFVIGYIAA